MSYFDDLYFIAGGEATHCRVTVNRGWPEMCNLQLALAGEVFLEIDGGERHIITSPSVFWHHPAHVYHYGPVEPGGSWHHFWVTFRGQRALRIMERGFMPLSDLGYLPVAQVRSVETDFRSLVQLVASEGPAVLPQATLLLERLLWLLEPGQSAAATPHEDAIQAVASRLREAPCEDVDLRDLAASCHLSYSHFRRLFREQIGAAPLDYHLQCRMRWAARQLQDPVRQVQDVAAAAGYRDPAQFSKLFKRKIGLSPQQYRQSLPGLSSPSS